jgi:hypothetical protein
MEEREKTREVQSRNARAKQIETFHEPTKEHAAPTELDEKPVGFGGYRHGAPTELFKRVHGPNAGATGNGAPNEGTS